MLNFSFQSIFGKIYLMKNFLILLFVFTSFSLNAQVRKYTQMVKVTHNGPEAPIIVEAILVFNSPNLTFYKNDYKYNFKIISDIEDCPSIVTNEIFICFTVELESSGDEYWFKLTEDGEKFSMQKLAPNSVVQVFSN